MQLLSSIVFVVALVAVNCYHQQGDGYGSGYGNECYELRIIEAGGVNGRGIRCGGTIPDRCEGFTRFIDDGYLEYTMPDTFTDDQNSFTCRGGNCPLAAPARSVSSWLNSDLSLEFWDEDELCDDRIFTVDLRLNGNIFNGDCRKRFTSIDGRHYVTLEWVPTAYCQQ